MLDTLRPQRFLVSSNHKVGKYVNELTFEDVFYIEKHMNTMFAVDNLNFFVGNSTIPAFTSMDGQNHKDRKIPMKNFLSELDDIDKILDNFFEELEDDFDAHQDFSQNVISELLYQLFGIDKSNNEMIHLSLEHIFIG